MGRQASNDRTADLLAGMRVLLVEDEPLIAMALQAAMQEAGAGVTVASTDRAAYDLLSVQATRLDVLITDIDLREGTTGYDVARFARARNEAIAVIYTSGGSDDRGALFGVPGALFLTKPLTEPHFLSAVASLVRANSAKVRLSIAS